MQRQISHKLLDKLPGEIEYLGYLAKNIYHEEPGLIDFIKYDLGFGGFTPKIRNKYHERISREDHEKILALINHLQSVYDGNTDCSDQELINSYGNGYTQQTGLPVWVKSTPLYQAILDNEKRLAAQKNTLAENLIIIGDIVKRGTDLTEDIVSTLRSANLLNELSNASLRGTIGGLNVINVTYEFLKASYDFIKSYFGDDNHRPEILAESGMRAAWSLTGIATLILYITRIIFLPVALLGISIVMLPIFMVILWKDTYLYLEAKNNDQESSALNVESKFNKTLNQLESPDKKDLLTYDDLYQLASMKHRQANDSHIREYAAREVRYTAIDLGAYLFITAASCTAIATYYVSHPIQVLLGNLALAATITGVTVATVAKLWKSREAIAEFIIAIVSPIHEWCQENIYTPIYEWCKQGVINAYQWYKEKSTDLFPPNESKKMNTNNPIYQLIINDPDDASEYGSGHSTSSEFSVESIRGDNANKRVAEIEKQTLTKELENKQTKPGHSEGLTAKTSEMKSHNISIQKPITRTRTKSTSDVSENLPSTATSHFTKFTSSRKDSEKVSNKRNVQSSSYTL